ncbi:hypothetical protein P9139_06880 [Curtobacterium flaccumfaciens]|nr:hypothetical protein P9139_06880 [Curtobacterium flaccumfaciens]
MHDEERQVDRPVRDERHQVGDVADTDRLGTVQVSGQDLAEHDLAVVDEYVPGDRGRDARLLLELRGDGVHHVGVRALRAQGLLDPAELERRLPSGSSTLPETSA